MQQYRRLWGYGGRYWIEISIALGVIAILIYLQLKISLAYVNTAQLTEPLGLARNMQIQMAIHSAMTGEWPVETSSSVDQYKFSKIIQAYKQTKDGHILLHLASDQPGLDNQYMAFNLYENDAGAGYKMYIWNCGGVKAPQIYQAENPLISTLPAKFTNVICRNNNDSK